MPFDRIVRATLTVLDNLP